jgi:hypothetical protein
VLDFILKIYNDKNDDLYGNWAVWVMHANRQLWAYPKGLMWMIFHYGICQSLSHPHFSPWDTTQSFLQKTLDLLWRMWSDVDWRRTRHEYNHVPHASHAFGNFLSLCYPWQSWPKVCPHWYFLESFQAQQVSIWLLSLFPRTSIPGAR